MRRTSALLLLALGLCAAAVIFGGGSALAAGTQNVPVSGTGGPQTGPFTPWDGNPGPEFPGGSESDETPFAGNGVVDRSLSRGNGKPVSPGNGNGRSKSNPTLGTSFEGLNIYDQRFARGGNQFTVEPPDQGLCAGNGFVMEMVNDVVNVYNTSGASVLPDNTATNIVSGFPRNVEHAVDLNSFYGYGPAVDRSKRPAVRGEFVTDPSCLYDAQTNRWFAVVLTLDPQVGGPCQGVFSCQNHLDIAVSKSGDPTVANGWRIYHVDVTSDGTNAGGVNPCPCLGDYPHIGADANGFYVTTNAYPFLPGKNGFDGAQIYAFSKAQLAAGAFTVAMQHFDTSGMVDSPTAEGAKTQPGFTLWPSQSPSGQFAGDTEYFLSSNAADEAQEPVSGNAGPHTSDQLVIWTLSNTSSLNSGTPSLTLSDKVIDNVDPYAVPPKAQQPGSGSAPGVNAPQGHCLNDTTAQLNPALFGAGVFGCWKLLVGARFSEVVSSPDSNDTRMQQVTYANGKLWGALDTAVSVGGGSRAGIAYYVVNPSAGKVMLQGYLADAGFDYTYPAIGVLPNGRGVMAFTVTGDGQFPSTGYTSMDAIGGAGPVHIVQSGQAPDDGFTGYRSQSSPAGAPPRTRWGDYSATAVDGNSIWIASEYIGGKCDFTDWGGPFFANGTGDNLLGTCGGMARAHGVRTSIADWSTRISLLEP
jgi:hypothetical protein